MNQTIALFVLLIGVGCLFFAGTIECWIIGKDGKPRTDADTHIQIISIFIGVTAFLASVPAFK